MKVDDDELRAAVSDAIANDRVRLNGLPTAADIRAELDGRLSTGQIRDRLSRMDDVDRRQTSVPGRRGQPITFRVSDDKPDDDGADWSKYRLNGGEA